MPSSTRKRKPHARANARIHARRSPRNTAGGDGRGQPAAAPIASLPAECLRWCCDPASLPFDSTAEVTPTTGVIGQESAVDALRFGLEIHAPGQNVFVRGLTGTGRMTLVRRLLEEIRLSCPETKDRCYVHNFSQPDHPRLITLSRGQGREFAHRVDELADFIRDDLKAALDSEPVIERRHALEQETQQRVARIVEPFEHALKDEGLALVSFQAGPAVQTALAPRVDGKPVSAEDYEQLRASGQVSEEEYTRVRERHDAFQQQLEEVSAKVNKVRTEHAEALLAIWKKEARDILGRLTARIEREFPSPRVQHFLNEIVEDVVTRRRRAIEKENNFTRLYRVNVILGHGDGPTCPIIIENTPTVGNLLGTLDHVFNRGEGGYTDHTMIRAGALLRADGGYLILDARDCLREPGAWHVLMRTLRTGRLEIVPPDMMIPWWGPTLKPEPIDLNLKVILLGDWEIYYLLDAYDSDFPELFKVLADFDSVVPRNDRSVSAYAGVLARIAKEESLPPFDRTAMAALLEHGARVAASKGKLTTRFGRLADIAREAAFVSGKAGAPRVNGEDVREAVRRGKQRADLPSRRFRELVAEGTVRVQMSGAEVGQINGLAVMTAGPLTYGFPARITATIGPGTSGVINIEREAALSGAIHTKGFYILGGLLRFLLRTDHPLAFDASVAFEQSYGGIDGDSASGAEICCLLSALTDVPLRQDLAMTGAIDQVGHLLAVGAVNEKIEGFFDACRDAGLTGTQGVIIPRANAGDLMLREDVVEACGLGRFSVFAVDAVHEALELFTGMPSGRRGREGLYPPGTLLARALDRAWEYWLKASRSAEGAPPARGESGVRRAAARPLARSAVRPARRPTRRR